MLEKYRETELCQNYSKLEAAFKECQQNMLRIANMLEIYKKDSEKYKM
jgi:hypothetical protein